MNNLRYCPFCGEEIKDEERWCPYCGAELPHEEKKLVATLLHCNASSIKSMAKKKAQAFGKFSILSPSMPPLTYDEALDTAWHIKEMVERFCKITPNEERYKETLKHTEAWFGRLRKEKRVPQDESGFLDFLFMFDFVDHVIASLMSDNDTSEEDKRFLTLLSVRVMHIYFATDIVDFTKRNIPEIYEMAPAELCEEIDWSLLKQSLDEKPKPTKPQTPPKPVVKPQPPEPQPSLRTTGPRAIEPLPEDAAIVDGLAKELSDNCPRVTAIPYDPNNDYWAEMDALIGLGRVKEELHRHISSYKVQLERKKEHPDLQLNTSFNCIFKGKPGTGKTTVARLMAGILRQEGILSRGHCVETSDAQLCGQYVGITPKITKYTALLSRGGVLFIDEAYNLANHKGNNVDFGREVIDTLTPMLENTRDGNSPILAILAGYDKEMDEFLSGANTGFGSRFQYVFHFDDYNADEMLEIFHRMIKANYYYLTDDAEKIAKKLFMHIDSQRASLPTFANARTVRSVFETIAKKANARIAQNLDSTDKDMITADDLKLSQEELHTACGML